MEDRCLCPIGITPPVCNACPDGNRAVERSRVQISYFQPPGHGITPRQVVQQPYHCSIEDCSNYTSLGNAVIPLEPFVYHQCACVLIFRGRELHVQSDVVFRSTSKAVFVKYFTIPSFA
jgi:hypothetical protein